MLISLPCSKIATAACPLCSLSSCAFPDTRGSHAVWKGFSLLHYKLFPEINRQLLMAHGRGTGCLGALSLQGVHDKRAGGPCVLHRPLPAECTLTARVQM